MKRTAEFNQVKGVIERYIQGTRTSDVEMLKQVFHPNAVMSGYLGPDLLIGSVQPFYEHLTNNTVEPEYVAEPSEIVVEGLTARARLIEDNLYGMSFINDFHLLKSHDNWQIVSKLFYHE
jgi:hypothetical protein